MVMVHGIPQETTAFFPLYEYARAVGFGLAFIDGLEIRLVVNAIVFPFELCTPYDIFPPVRLEGGQTCGEHLGSLTLQRQRTQLWERAG